jgi:hypothetical protein
MRSRPLAVAFDIIETVFSLGHLRSRLDAAGVPGQALEVWFAQTLRDAFALDATTGARSATVRPRSSSCSLGVLSRAAARCKSMALMDIPLISLIEI